MSDEPRPTLAALDERLVVELGAAFHQRAMYPTAHPQVRRSLERALEAQRAWIAATGRDEVSLLVVEDQLVVDRRPLAEDAGWRRGLLHAFAKHGLGGLTLRANLPAEELGQFLDSCFAPSGAVATRHVHFGKARHRDTSGSAETARADEPSASSRAEAEELGAASRELAALAGGVVGRMERLRGLVARLARSAASARLDPRGFAEAAAADRELGHGVEVALGSIRLGKALGVSSDVLEELGLAGLLHDLGHLDPSPSESADERRLRHTVRGALRLAAMDGVPESAVLAAYEHHLRWDGGENYPRLAAQRRPAAPARIVAVADTWATLRSRAGASPAEAATLIQDRAGSFLEPDLVRLFLVGLA